MTGAELRSRSPRLTLCTLRCDAGTRGRCLAWPGTARLALGDGQARAVTLTAVFTEGAAVTAPHTVAASGCARSSNSSNSGDSPGGTHTWASCSSSSSSSSSSWLLSWGVCCRPELSGAGWPGEPSLGGLGPPASTGRAPPALSMWTRLCEQRGRRGERRHPLPRPRHSRASSRSCWPSCRGCSSCGCSRRRQRRRSAWRASRGEAGGASGERGGKSPRGEGVGAAPVGLSGEREAERRPRGAEAPWRRSPCATSLLAGLSASS